MSAKAKFVLWCRHDPNQFLKATPKKLELFEISHSHDAAPAESTDSAGFSSEPASNFIRLRCNFEIHETRCLDISPDPVHPLLVAAGLGTGVLTLANFASDGKVVREFVPKTVRSCNAITWK
jgi:hypothetical protein